MPNSWVFAWVLSFLLEFWVFPLSFFAESRKSSLPYLLFGPNSQLLGMHCLKGNGYVPCIWVYSIWGQKVGTSMTVCLLPYKNVKFFSPAVRWPSKRATRSQMTFQNVTFLYCHPWWGTFPLLSPGVVHLPSRPFQEVDFLYFLDPSKSPLVYVLSHWATGNGRKNYFF